MAQCAIKILQMVMVIFNTAFVLMGGTILGLGIWMAVDPNAFDALDIANSAGMEDPLWSVAVYMMIGVGSVGLLLGFLGCVGSSKRNAPLLWLYSFLVLLLIAAEITVIVLALVYESQIDDSVQQSMTAQIKNDYTGNDDSVTNMWDSLQRNFECCGSEDYDDYKGSNFDNTNQLVTIPQSCCDINVDDTAAYAVCNAEAVTSSPGEYLYNKGCYYSIKDFIYQNSLIIACIVSILIGVQIVAVIFACCIKNHGKD